jgi:hypothetical protein
MPATAQDFLTDSQDVLRSRHRRTNRGLAALGIGGEWAVGASLLSETWPRRWRPWIAAVLQSGVNVGI